jgi:DUF971 family protein
MVTESAGGAPWPLEIRYAAATRRLIIDFDNGATYTYPAELLRVESPSAEVKGHGVGEKRIVAGRSQVGIMKIVPRPRSRATASARNASSPADLRSAS